MAHMVETMAWTGQRPWRGLGIEIPPDLSPNEILEAAELDWRVEKKDLHYYHDGAPRTATMKALIRESDGRELSIVSDKWQPIQNHEAFSVFNEFVERGGMTMETAGSLRDGRLVWALAKTRRSSGSSVTT